MHLFLINSICCKKKTKVNDLPLGQDYDWVKQFEKRGDLTYGARPYLMTLCFIFPIHVNFPIRPRGVLKTTIHRKKTGLYQTKLHKKNSVYCCLNKLGTTLHGSKPYAMLSERLQTTQYRKKSCAMSSENHLVTFQKFLFWTG